MLWLAADHDMVAAAAGQRLGQCRFRIEAFAVLVQRRHLDIGAETDAAGVGRIGSGEHFDQGGLAGAVRADDADAVAALNADREVVDDSAIAIATADVFGLDNEFAGFIRFGGGEIGVACRAAIVTPLLPQLVQVAEPFDVALAAARNAITQPVFLIDDLAVELVLLALFFRKHLVAPGLEARQAAIDLPDFAAVEPGGLARQIGEEAAIMADDDQRAAAAVEFAFEPFDRVEIEMVG